MPEEYFNIAIKKPTVRNWRTTVLGFLISAFGVGLHQPEMLTKPTPAHLGHFLLMWGAAATVSAWGVTMRDAANKTPPATPSGNPIIQKGG